MTKGLAKQDCTEINSECYTAALGVEEWLQTELHTILRKINCCLCLRSLISVSDLRKRKRQLFGDGCTKSVTILNEIMSGALHSSLKSYKETGNPSAYLCHLCDYHSARIVNS